MQSNNSDITVCSDSDSYCVPKPSNVASSVVISSDTGSERPGLQILDEFRKLYETRIRNVKGAGANAVEEKMKIMMEWIHDLDAQNTMLVRTVEELEEAACSRVKLLEEKLKETSNIITKNIHREIQPDDETLHQLSNRINQLERDESRLKSKVQCLECDIKSLLELIRRGQRENCWTLDGLKFLAINTSEIPMPAGAASDEESSRIVENSVQLFSDNTAKSSKYQQDLIDEIEHLQRKLLMKENKIEGLLAEFGNLKASFKEDDVIREISDSLDNKLIVQKYQSGEFDDEVNRLKNDVKNKTSEIARLSQQLNYLEKELTESRDTLTREVAEQHDKQMALREKVVELEDQCRQLSKQLLFKDTIIKDMRKEMKRAMSKEVLSHSPRKECNHSNMKVDWTDDSSDDHLIGKDNFQKYDRLLSIKRQLEEIMKFINDYRKEEVIDRTVEVTRVKTDNIQKILNNFDTDSSKSSRVDEAKETEMTSTKNKLMEIISTLTEICTEKGREIDELEVALQNVHGQNGSELESKNSNEAEVSRQQFGYMEEFRVCTVEAQAATEDLREEMEDIIGNLQGRHQLFSKLTECVEKIKIFIEKTQNNLSTIVDVIRSQLVEKIASQNVILSDQMKLKDLKNEINRARIKFDTPEACNELLDRFEYEFDDFLQHLGIFMSKETHGSTLVASLKTQIDQTVANLNDISKHTHRVLHDNAAAQKLFDERARKLDKLEGELDFAHTKMQDTLENIVFTHRDNESSEEYSNEDENRTTDTDIKELKSIICSKDTMLEHKDEIIRIQRQSIAMTQGELNEVHQRLQSKIDAQIVVINQYQEDIKNLLEQRNLQGQTIKHLQDAIVEAKKNLYRHPQKSLILPSFPNQRIKLIKQNADLKRQLVAKNADMNILINELLKNKQKK